MPSIFFLLSLTFVTCRSSRLFTNHSNRNANASKGYRSTRNLRKLYLVSHRPFLSYAYCSVSPPVLCIVLLALLRLFGQVLSTSTYGRTHPILFLFSLFINICLFFFVFGKLILCFFGGGLFARYGLH